MHVDWKDCLSFRWTFESFYDLLYIIVLVFALNFLWAWPSFRWNELVRWHDTVVLLLPDFLKYRVSNVTGLRRTPFKIFCIKSSPSYVTIYFKDLLAFIFYAWDGVLMFLYLCSLSHLLHIIWPVLFIWFHTACNLTFALALAFALARVKKLQRQ
jgi:hypothetical protein